MRFSPSASMSSAPRLAKCSMAPWRWNGHSGLMQRCSASPSGRTSVERSSHGHSVGNTHGSVPFGPVGHDRAQDLGDDVARPPHDHLVAGADVLGPDLVLVVQGRLADRHAADEDRLEHGVRAWPGRCGRSTRTMSFSRVVRSSGGNL